MSSNTSWQFYIDNPATWDAMIADCEAAKESINLENFIFMPDEIGNRFIDVCAKKAAEGVKVRFIWDAAGSFTFFSSSIVQDLRKKGIELIFFKTFFPGIFNAHRYRSWYFRNHRRTLVIDGKIGHTGSVCISKKMENWRDTSLRIEGPVVVDMQYSFEKMWRRAQEKSERRKLPRKNPVRKDHEFEYATTMPLPRKGKLNGRIVEAIRSARKRVYITVPYFVPTHRFARVIRLAAHRGVDVRILIPYSSDYPIVDIGARTFFHNFLKSGVRIFLYKGPMLHTKSIVIDDDWSTVGTLNLDYISLLYNYEANIISNNSHFAGELASHFEADLKNAEEVTAEDWDRRSYIEKITTFFVKFVRSFL